MDLGDTNYKFMDLRMDFKSLQTQVTQITSLWIHKCNFEIDLLQVDGPTVHFTQNIKEMKQ